MTFQVYVPRMNYRGHDKRKLEKKRRDDLLSHLIEEELQKRYDEMSPGEWRAILAYQVASAIRADVEPVRRIMCRIQGGSNGVTFYKPEGQKVPRRLEVSAPPPTQKQSTGGLLLGQRVEHGKFGAGVITHIAGELIEILFDLADRKKVVESYVRPIDNND